MPRSSRFFLNHPHKIRVSGLKTRTTTTARASPCLHHTAFYYLSNFSGGPPAAVEIEVFKFDLSPHPPPALTLMVPTGRCQPHTSIVRVTLYTVPTFATVACASITQLCVVVHIHRSSHRRATKHPHHHLVMSTGKFCTQGSSMPNMQQCRCNATAVLYPQPQPE